MDFGLWKISGVRYVQELFEELRQIYDDNITNKIIYWYDIQNLLVGVQDRITCVISYLDALYKIVPFTQYMKRMSINHAREHFSLSTSFDLFSKLVYEMSHLDK